MKANTVVAWVTLFGVLTFTGCASYTPGLAKLNVSGPDVSREAKGELAVYVEEYATEEKCRRAFDTNLAEEGVLAVLLLVENKGTQPFEVKVADITVCVGAACLKPLTPEEAAGKAKRSAVGRAIGWSMIVPIIGIPVAVVASAEHTGKVNKQIIQDFAAKSFPDGIVTANKEQYGFLFFKLDEGRNDLTGLRLELTAKNMSSGEVVEIGAPLTSARLKKGDE